MNLLLLAIIAVALPLITFFSSQQYIQQAAASGNIYYVSKNGNNADGKSWSTAWNELKNINWSVVQPGDTVFIDGGSSTMTYTTTLTVGKSGVQGSPITIKKAPDTEHNGHVIIFGGRTIPLPYCNQSNYTPQTSGINSSGINMGTSSWIVIDGDNWEGITIHGAGNQGIAFAPGSSNDTIRNLETYDNGAVKGSPGNFWPSDEGGGVLVYGSNHLFEQVNIHDDAGDSFQPYGDNITINRSWLHQSREDPTQPGTPFNQCEHQDGYQIWGGHAHTGITIENSIISGQKEGVQLGQGPKTLSSGGILWAQVNNVTFRNVLWLNKVINVFDGGGQDPTTGAFANNWTLDHVTVVGIPNTSVSLWLHGSNLTVTNSIFYYGHMLLSSGVGQSSGNCQWKTDTDTAAVKGQTVNPQFVTDVSGFTSTTPLLTIEQANFALRSGSPCLGAGSSITSVAQFLQMVQSSQPSSQPTVPTSSGSPTSPQGGTSISLTLCPHGIANCGDNANPQSMGNMNPLHTTRTVTASLSDINNTPLTSAQGTVTFDTASGTFKGTISLNSLPAIASGQYILRVTLPQYLTRQIGTVINITSGQTNTTPQVSLIAGDINGDNKLDILDYNILVNCFGSKANTPSCNNQSQARLPTPGTGEQAADIEDDGKVDGVDYNLFLRELSVQNGN